MNQKISVYRPRRHVNFEPEDKQIDSFVKLELVPGVIPHYYNYKRGHTQGYQQPKWPRHTEPPLGKLRSTG